METGPGVDEPLVSAEEVFSRIKKDLEAPLVSPEAHSSALVRRWCESLRDLGLPDQQVSKLLDKDLESLRRNLQTTNFQSFREHIYALGHELARHGVKLHHGIAAMESLIESTLPEKSQDAAAAPWRESLAGARLCLFVTRIAVAGYIREQDAEHRALAAKVRQGEQRVRSTSAKLTTMYERERSKMSRVLHDQLASDLVVLKLYLEDIGKELKERTTSELSAEVKDSLKLVAHALRSLRRLMVDLGPSVLKETGLLPVIRMYVRQYSSRTWIDVTVQAADLPDDIPFPRSLAVYRVLQETLALSRQDRASNIKISIAARDEFIVMDIEDDGVVLDAASRSVQQSLAILRDHTEALGGVISIRSPVRAKKGTRIEVRMPLHGARNSAQPE